MSIIVTKKIIKALKPCGDRYENYIEYYSDFNGTLEEFLFLPLISHKDKLWVALRLLPLETIEIFTLDCELAAQNYASASCAIDAVASYYFDISSSTIYDASAIYAAIYAASAAIIYALDSASEKDNQIDSLIYLSNLKEN